MRKPKKIKLYEGEWIFAVVPERCAGPGWCNAPAWVYITSSNGGKMREECIQPDERTPELDALFMAGEAMVRSLKSAVPTSKKKLTPTTLG